MGAWLVLAVDDADRTHGGNDGYDDEPSRHYSWDSTVPNHANIAVGDVIALWDKKSLLGVSVIEAIDVDQAEKDTYACPACGRASFKARRTKTPTYLCWDCRAEFDTPVAHRKQVTTYRSRHGTGWVDMPGLLTGAQLRSLCDSPKSQQSLRPFDWDRMRAAILATGQPTSVEITDAARQAAIPGGHKTTVVRARVGQATFRRRLLIDHGQVCAFTGPAPAAALEAAHLYSYAADGQHHPDGGLLLRRDLHRLFDLGLIAVNPASLTLDVSPQLAGFTAYTQLHGQTVHAALTKGHHAWLQAHWNLHRPPAYIRLPHQAQGQPGADRAAAT
ncbi:HNH endonuclease [Streptomyces sp. NPDC046866]|uniref:HNH endonuclease n=1 Tax=Streptomyces sp. NPDC046866 TaxID=3154921 RepID=UPI00345114C1